MIARALGIVSGEVTILPTVGHCLGHSEFNNPRFCWSRGDGDKAIAANNFAIALYAGAEAERLILGNHQFGDWIDRQIAVDCLAWAGAIRGASFVGDESFDRHEANLRRKAKALVITHREKIERLAEALIQREALCGDEVDVVLST